MTVKCLNDAQKAAIVYQFTFLKLSLNEIAEGAKRSRRTIIRVLEEEGIDPGIKHRPPRVVEVVKTVTVPVEPPELTPMEYLKCLFRAVFKKKKTNANVAHD